jgi:predicted enzyme related to lactoylglutathione lyase
MADHPVVHIQIPVTSLEGGSEFYEKLFGWKTSIMPEYNYGGWETGNGVGGGFSPIDGDGTVAGDVLVHVGTTDIDGDLAKVGELGGTTVVPKTEIPGIGWFGIFTDPAGNRIALYTDASQAS